MAFSELTGDQIAELSTALVKAFPTQPKLKEVVRVKLDRNIDELSDGSLKQRTMEIIEAAEAEGWTSRLIEGAYAHNPGNPALKQFYQKYAGSVQRSFSQKGLERIVDSAGGFEDIVAWREKLAQIELQVCRVEVLGAAKGTGFLVGDDLVMTNYHVIEGKDLSTMNVRFDHKILADGTTINSGKVYKVTGAAVDESPYSSLDLVFPHEGIPGVDQLDYALLRLAAPASADIVEGKKRAFMLPSKQPSPKEGLMFIVQHPSGRPLQVAFDSILELNENRTRITYKTSTEGGSSGSPGFDRDWNLIALHHGGDPRFDQQATFNEGIPIETIQSNMKPAIKALLGWT